MLERRIGLDLGPTDHATARMERHAYINLINVVHAELQLIERMVDMPGSLRSAIHLCEAAGRAYREARAANRHLAELVRFHDLITGDLGEVVAEAGAAADEEDVREALGILGEVLPDAETRVQEVVARHAIARPGHPYTASGFTQELSRRTGHAPSVEVAGAPSVVLPRGIERTVAVLLVGLSGPHWPAAEAAPAVRFTAGPQPGVEIEGPGSQEQFQLLARGNRPSTIHDGGPLDDALRGAMMLCYLSVPGGEVRVGEPTPGRLVLRSTLGRCRDPDEID